MEKLNRYRISINSSLETDYTVKREGAFTDDTIKLIPRLALIFKPTKLHSLKFLYGKAIKQPSLIQDASQFHSDYPSLLPAYIETFEINYLLSPTQKVLINFSLYKNNIKDLIVKRNIYDPNSGRWILHSTNSGKMSTKKCVPNAWGYGGEFDLVPVSEHCCRHRITDIGIVIEQGFYDFM